MKVTYMEIATASGKRGGVVGGQWKGIPWLRKRSIPSNPRTPDQMAQRAQMAGAVEAVLTAFADPALKDTWDTWAATNPFRSKNGLGTQILPGYQAALVVALARISSNFLPQLGNLPTLPAPPVPAPSTELGQENAGSIWNLVVTRNGGFFTPADQLIYWAALTKPSRSPNYRHARKVANQPGNAATQTDVTIKADVLYDTWYDAWTTRFQPQYSKEPSPPLYLGRQHIGFP